MKLVRYEAARQALAKAARVDEAKDIRDKALVLEAYAKQANDRDMLKWVNEIRLRAERRSGELLREIEKRPGGKKRLRSSTDESNVPSLKDLGITHNQSSQWQRLAAIPGPEFERRLAEVSEASSQLTTKKVLQAPPRRAPSPHKPAGVKTRADACFFEVEARIGRSWPTLSHDERSDLVDSLGQLLKQLQGEIND